MLNPEQKLFILEHIFPNGTIDRDRILNNEHSRRIEINGLDKGTDPFGVNILYAGLETGIRNDRREHMLIEAFGTYIHLRICTAYPGSGYDEFALINNMEYTNDYASKELKEYAIRSINAICSQITINNLDDQNNMSFN